MRIEFGLAILAMDIGWWDGPRSRVLGFSGECDALNARCRVSAHSSSYADVIDESILHAMQFGVENDDEEKEDEDWRIERKGTVACWD